MIDQMSKYWSDTFLNLILKMNLALLLQSQNDLSANWQRFVHINNGIHLVQVDKCFFLIKE